MFITLLILCLLTVFSVGKLKAAQSAFAIDDEAEVKYPSPE
jgi:hypothetical protein